MAKANRKTQQVPATVSAVDVACAALVPIFVAFASKLKADAEVNASRSKAIVAILVQLFGTFTDRALYAAAILDLLGDASKKGTKEEREARKGKLAHALKAAGVQHVQVAKEISLARTLAANLHLPAVMKAATESGLRAGYDAAKPAAPATAEPAAPAAKGVSIASTMAAAVEADGMPAVLGVLVSYYTVKADPIRANIIREAIAKLTAIAA